jgi:alpha-amylase
MKADSLKKLYFIGSKYKYSSKAAALEALAKDNLKLEKNLNPNQSPASDEGNAQKFVKPVQAEEAAKDGYTKVYIKLDVEKYPEDANVYIWTDGANDEAASGWPGTPMAHIGNGWHSVNLPNRVIATEDAEITDANENKEATDETLDVQTDESANKDEEVIKDDVLNDSVDSEQKSENEAKDVEEQSDAEEESEESSGVLDEVKDFFQELVQGVVAFFNPMPKVMAAEYHTFAPGVHVIINNGDGFQEDDVNPRFTTVRPSAQELNQDAEAKDNKAADENAETGTEEAKAEVKEPVASTETTPVASQPSKGSSSSSSSSSSVVPYTKASVVPTPNGDEAAKVEETPKADTVTQVASTQTSKKKSNSGLRKSEDNKKSAMAETNTETQESEDTKDTEEAPKEEVKVADATVDTKDENTEVTVEDEPVPEGINDNDTKATFPIAPVLAVAFLCVVGAAVLIKKNAKAE